MLKFERSYVLDGDSPLEEPVNLFLIVCEKC